MGIILPNGYEMQTTFWMDFSIADIYGIDAIKDTYNRSFNEWKSNHIYLTELAIVLNHKIWQHWENGNDEMGRLYDELWKKTDEYAIKHLKGKELEFYYKTTD